MNKKIIAIFLLCTFLLSIISVSAVPIKLKINNNQKKNEETNKTKETKNQGKLILRLPQNVTTIKQFFGGGPTAHGPITITRAYSEGNLYIGENFNVIIEASDPDDEVTAISLGREPYGSGNWNSQSCDSNRCEKTWSLSEQSPGTYVYRIMARNSRGQTISSSLTLELIDRPVSSSFIFRTAAMDAGEFLTTGVVDYINNVEINVINSFGSVSSVGIPFANFNVHTGNIFSVSYKKQGYVEDTDYFYIDPLLNSCNSHQCIFSSNGYDTVCNFIPAANNYNCRLSSEDYDISFIYSRSDPNVGNFVIRFVNTLYTSNTPIVNFRENPVLNLNEDSGEINFDLNPHLFYNGNRDEISWVVENNGGLNIDVIRNHALINSRSNWIGNQNVRFVAVSPDGLESADTLLISVRNIDNDAPVIVSKNPEEQVINLHVDSTKRFSVNAVDYDYDSLNFVWSVNNIEVSNDYSFFDFTPSNAGENNIELVINDGINSVRTTWKINSDYIEELNKPTISNLLITPTVQSQNNPVNIAVTAIDDSALESVKARIIYIDDLPMEFQMINSGVDKYEITFDETSFLGSYGVIIIARDVFGNQNFISGSFEIIETNKPVISYFVADPVLQDSSRPVSLNAEISDDSSIESISLTIVSPHNNNFNINIPVEGNGVYSYNFLDTNELGIYSAVFTVMDIYGNENSAIAQFNVRILDEDAPEVTINSPLSGSIIGDTSSNIEFDAIDGITDIVFCGYSIDSSPVVEIDDCNDFQITDLSVGEHSLTISARDERGNVGFETINFIINLNGSVHGFVVGDNGVLIPGALIDIYQNNEIVHSVLSNDDGSFNFNIERGSYIMNANSDFSLGNTIFMEGTSGLFNLNAIQDLAINISMPSRIWWDNDWDYKRELIVNNPSDEILVDFPFLANSVEGTIVGINTASLISENKLKSDCSDLRFVSSDETTELPFEFESKNDLNYGCNSGNTMIWVKGTLNQGDNIFYIYYGNNDALDGENSNEVWDENYVGVYHFGDINGGTIKDSSIYNINGVMDSLSHINNGFYGNGLLSLNNTEAGRTVILPNIPNNIIQVSGEEYTVEVYFNQTRSTYENIILETQKSGSGVRYLLISGQSPDGIKNVIEGVTHKVNANEGRIFSESPIIKDIWNSVTLSYGDLMFSIIMNNEIIGLDYTGIGNLVVPDNGIFIGSYHTPIDHLVFGGVIDEIRLSDIKRSDSWILRSSKNELSSIDEELAI